MICPMKRNLLFLAIFISLFLSGCSKINLGKKQSALQVTSSPAASVYVNGSHMGQTPYFDDKLKPGQYSIRILIDNDPTKDWQTQVNLNPSVVTVINRSFGIKEDESSSYILAFEPVTKKDSSQLNITTVPDNVIIKVDGRPEGFSPLSLENVTEGDHALVLTAPGYQEMSINTQTKNGFRLNVAAQLARSPEIMAGSEVDTATDSAKISTPSSTLAPTAKTTPKPTSKVTPSPSPKLSPTPSGSPTPTKKAASPEIEKPYVIVTETGTGWLRVRSAPEVGDNEVAKVDVGEKFPFLEKTEDGWYKIEYETGKEGYIVSRYAQLVE